MERKNYWTQYSIGELMKNEKTAKAILEQVADDSFLLNYFKTFGQNAKHSFAEVEGGSQMAGAITKERFEKIKNALECIAE